MKSPEYITLDITPMPAPRPLKKGAPPGLTRLHFEKYKREIYSITKAKRFKATSAMKVIFIIPTSKLLSPKDRVLLIGEPHTTGKMAITKLVDGIRQALLEDHEDIHRIEASKYWGEKGKILIRNITSEDFDYLRQIK